MKQIKIREKMALIVISGTLLSALFGTVLIYQVVQRNLLASESVKLQKITAKFTSVATERFEESHPKLANLEFAGEGLGCMFWFELPRKSIDSIKS